LLHTAPQEVDDKVAAVMKSYDTELNHMSIRRFRRMLSKHTGLDVTYKELKPAKYSSLGFLTRIPFARELLTGTVVCRLERARR
jgi:hypothetical protein